ncbi:MAG: DNA adenine methylase, partial [Lactobacillus sp.]|nr:DNA adenine methylase [Lactobacillus sp.]
MGFRYIGSKEKLANSIIDIILQEVPGAKSFIDLMAGTGNFSLALRRRGFSVIASDVMTYSLHHLRVALLLNQYPFFNGLVGRLEGIILNCHTNYDIVLNYLNGLNGKCGYFFNEFSPKGNPIDASKPRMYYTSDNAKKIDAIREQIKEWHEANLISEIEHSLLLHTLILDSNDIANIAGTYGHYLSHFVQRSLSPIILKACEIEQDKNTNHIIYLGYAEDVAIKCKGDVCYIDPPYIKRQYAANYHILETLAREDFPVAAGESGLRPWRDQYSNFCSKLKIRSSFSKIIESVD